jgi:hypothetical protein
MHRRLQFLSVILAKAGIYGRIELCAPLRRRPALALENPRPTARSAESGLMGDAAMCIKDIIQPGAEPSPEETIESDERDLFEMANLYPDTTGLPMTVSVSQ